jgi:DNA mismatch repair protein MutS
MAISEAEAVQLTMFAEAAPAKEHTGKPKKSLTSAQEKLLQKLRRLDIMRMTPLEALEWLNDAKQQLLESGD